MSQQLQNRPKNNVESLKNQNELFENNLATSILTKNLRNLYLQGSAEADRNLLMAEQSAGKSKSILSQSARWFTKTFPDTIGRNYMKIAHSASGIIQKGIDAVKSKVDENSVVDRLVGNTVESIGNVLGGADNIKIITELCQDVFQKGDKYSSLEDVKKAISKNILDIFGGQKMGLLTGKKAQLAMVLAKFMAVVDTGGVLQAINNRDKGDSRFDFAVQKLAETILNSRNEVAKIEGKKDSVESKLLTQIHQLETKVQGSVMGQKDKFDAGIIGSFGIGTMKMIDNVITSSAGLSEQRRLEVIRLNIANSKEFKKISNEIDTSNIKPEEANFLKTKALEKLSYDLYLQVANEEFKTNQVLAKRQSNFLYRVADGIFDLSGIQKLQGKGLDEVGFRAIISAHDQKMAEYSKTELSESAKQLENTILDKSSNFATSFVDKIVENTRKGMTTVNTWGEQVVGGIQAIPFLGKLAVGSAKMVRDMLPGFVGNSPLVATAGMVAYQVAGRGFAGQTTNFTDFMAGRGPADVMQNRFATALGTSTDLSFGENVHNAGVMFLNRANAVGQIWNMGNTGFRIAEGVAGRIADFTMRLAIPDAVAETLNTDYDQITAVFGGKRASFSQVQLENQHLGLVTARHAFDGNVVPDKVYVRNISGGQTEVLSETDWKALPENQRGNFGVFKIDQAQSKGDLVVFSSISKSERASSLELFSVTEPLKAGTEVSLKHSQFSNLAGLNGVVKENNIVEISFKDILTKYPGGRIVSDGNGGVNIVTSNEIVSFGKGVSGTELNGASGIVSAMKVENGKILLAINHVPTGFTQVAEELPQTPPVETPPSTPSEENNNTPKVQVGPKVNLNKDDSFVVPESKPTPPPAPKPTPVVETRQFVKPEPIKQTHVPVVVPESKPTPQPRIVNTPPPVVVPKSEPTPPPQVVEKPVPQAETKPIVKDPVKPTNNETLNNTSTSTKVPEVTQPTVKPETNNTPTNTSVRTNTTVQENLNNLNRTNLNQSQSNTNNTNTTEQHKETNNNNSNHNDRVNQNKTQQPAPTNTEHNGGNNPTEQNKETNNNNSNNNQPTSNSSENNNNQTHQNPTQQPASTNTETNNTPNNPSVRTNSTVQENLNNLNQSQSNTNNTNLTEQNTNQNQESDSTIDLNQQSNALNIATQKLEELNNIFTGVDQQLNRINTNPTNLQEAYNSVKQINIILANAEKEIEDIGNSTGNNGELNEDLRSVQGNLETYKTKLEGLQEKLTEVANQNSTTTNNPTEQPNPTTPSITLNTKPSNNPNIEALSNLFTQNTTENTTQIDSSKIKLEGFTFNPNLNGVGNFTENTHQEGIIRININDLNASQSLIGAKPGTLVEVTNDKGEIINRITTVGSKNTDGTRVSTTPQDAERFILNLRTEQSSKSETTQGNDGGGTVEVPKGYITLTPLNVNTDNAPLTQATSLTSDDLVNLPNQSESSQFQITINNEVKKLGFIQDNETGKYIAVVIEEDGSILKVDTTNPNIQALGQNDLTFKLFNGFDPNTDISRDVNSTHTIDQHIYGDTGLSNLTEVEKTQLLSQVSLPGDRNFNRSGILAHEIPSVIASEMSNVANVFGIDQTQLEGFIKGGRNLSEVENHILLKLESGDLTTEQKNALNRLLLTINKINTTFPNFQNEFTFQKLVGGDRVIGREALTTQEQQATLSALRLVDMIGPNGEFSVEDIQQGKIIGEGASETEAIRHINNTLLAAKGLTMTLEVDENGNTAYNNESVFGSRSWLGLVDQNGVPKVFTNLVAQGKFTDSQLAFIKEQTELAKTGQGLYGLSDAEIVEIQRMQRENGISPSTADQIRMATLIAGIPDYLGNASPIPGITNIPNVQNFEEFNGYLLQNIFRGQTQRENDPNSFVNKVLDMYSQDGVIYENSYSGTSVDLTINQRPVDFNDPMSIAKGALSSVLGGNFMIGADFTQTDTHQAGFNLEDPILTEDQFQVVINGQENKIIFDLSNKGETPMTGAEMSYLVQALTGTVGVGIGGKSSTTIRDSIGTLHQVEMTYTGTEDLDQALNTYKQVLEQVVYDPAFNRDDVSVAQISQEIESKAEILRQNGQITEKEYQIIVSLSQDSKVQQIVFGSQGKINGAGEYGNMAYLSDFLNTRGRTLNMNKISNVPTIYNDVTISDLVSLQTNSQLDSARNIFNNTTVKEFNIGEDTSKSIFEVLQKAGEEGTSFNPNSVKLPDGYKIQEMTQQQLIDSGYFKVFTKPNGSGVIAYTTVMTNGNIEARTIPVENNLKWHIVTDENGNIISSVRKTDTCDMNLDIPIKSGINELFNAESIASCLERGDCEPGQYEQIMAQFQLSQALIDKSKSLAETSVRQNRHTFTGPLQAYTKAVYMAKASNESIKNQIVDLLPLYLDNPNEFEQVRSDFKNQTGLDITPEFMQAFLESSGVAKDMVATGAIEQVYSNTVGLSFGIGITGFGLKFANEQVINALAKGELSIVGLTVNDKGEPCVTMKVTSESKVEFNNQSEITLAVVAKFPEPEPEQPKTPETPEVRQPVAPTRPPLNPDGTPAVTVNPNGTWTLPDGQIVVPPITPGGVPPVMVPTPEGIVLLDPITRVPIPVMPVATPTVTIPFLNNPVEVPNLPTEVVLPVPLSTGSPVTTIPDSVVIPSGTFLPTPSINPDLFPVFNQATDGIGNIASSF